MTDLPEVLVLGAGVIGLTAAVELLARGHRVEVWTRDPIDRTTSSIAAAVWHPYLAEPRERVLAWSRATFETYMRQSQDEPRAGVRRVEFVQCFPEPDPDVWWRDIVPTIRFLPRVEVPAPFRAAIGLTVPVADTRAYLPWLEARVRELGGVVRARTVASLDELAGAATRAVVHATGLGAAQLAGDASVVPIRGQVLVAKARAGATGFIGDSGDRPLYAIPRGDELVLGGTAQVGDARTASDAADSAAILGALAPYVPGLDERDVVAAKVGLRPGRPTVRLEREKRPGSPPVVHNYGHGGSGFTVAWGCAREAAELVE